MKRTHIYVGMVALIFLICITGQVLAADPEKKPENWGQDQGGDIPLIGENRVQQLDKAQDDASALLLKAARWVDSFFDDERSLSEENKTRGTLKLQVGYSKNDDFEIKPRLDVRLKLPGLSSRAQLIIQAAEDEDFDIENDPISGRPSHEDSENNELTAALRFFLKESEKYNLTFDTGASWDYLYVSLRYRAIQKFGSWNGRFTNRLRWYTDDGWENKASYDLETQIKENWLFRSTTGVNFYEDEDGIPHSQNFRVYNVMSSYQAMSYEVTVTADTEPSYKVTDTQLLVTYRQRFYRDWLVLEVAPKVTFPEDHDYDINPGIIFKLEATFGYDANKEAYKKVFR